MPLIFAISITCPVDRNMFTTGKQTISRWICFHSGMLVLRERVDHGGGWVDDGGPAMSVTGDNEGRSHVVAEQRDASGVRAVGDVERSAGTRAAECRRLDAGKVDVGKIDSIVRRHAGYCSGEA